MNGNIFIALGSNMGVREGNLLRAIAELGNDPDIRVTALSPFYETEPVGPVDQPEFINAAAQLESPLPPEELLNRLLQIEEIRFKRRRERVWGPRSMDLDLLFYGDRVITRPPALVIPHPHLHLRRFVLAPLADIAADFAHPVTGKTVARHLAELPAGERVTRL